MARFFEHKKPGGKTEYMIQDNGRRRIVSESEYLYAKQMYEAVQPPKFEEKEPDVLPVRQQVEPIKIKEHEPTILMPSISTKPLQVQRKQRPPRKKGGTKGETHG